MWQQAFTTPLSVQMLVDPTSSRTSLMIEESFSSSMQAVAVRRMAGCSACTGNELQLLLPPYPMPNDLDDFPKVMRDEH